jgi:hypothetical protein
VTRFLLAAIIQGTELEVNSLHHQASNVWRRLVIALPHQMD